MSRGVRGVRGAGGCAVTSALRLRREYTALRNGHCDSRSTKSAVYGTLMSSIVLKIREAHTSVQLVQSVEGRLSVLT